VSVVGFIGGTGPQGRGLGLRFAVAGHEVLLGSRDAAKAEEAVTGLRPQAPDAVLEGVSNEDACARADLVVVTVPYAAQAPTLRGLADAIGGKIVVNCVNNLAFDEQGPHAVAVPDGSAAQECARLLPDARVVSAFSNVSARKLLAVPEPVEVDVLICGDDDDAKTQVAELAAAVPGMRGVDAGPLRLAGAVEDLTAVLLSLNRRYKIHAGIRIDGLER
jgi:NADPH-dependent F420 reductase